MICHFSVETVRKVLPLTPPVTRRQVCARIAARTGQINARVDETCAKSSGTITSHAAVDCQHIVDNRELVSNLGSGF